MTDNFYKNTEKAAKPDMDDLVFIRCPTCGGKTRDKIRADTELKNFPLFCPKCHLECTVDVKRLQVIVHRKDS